MWKTAVTMGFTLSLLAVSPEASARNSGRLWNRFMGLFRHQPAASSKPAAQIEAPVAMRPAAPPPMVKPAPVKRAPKVKNVAMRKEFLKEWRQIRKSPAVQQAHGEMNKAVAEHDRVLREGLPMSALFTKQAAVAAVAKLDRTMKDAGSHYADQHFELLCWYSGYQEARQAYRAKTQAATPQRLEVKKALRTAHRKRVEYSKALKKALHKFD